MGADNTYGETYFNPETMDKKPTDKEIELKAESKYPDSIQQEAFRKGAKYARMVSKLETHANNAVEEIGNDVRNKLSPIKNLLAMIQRLEVEVNLDVADAFFGEVNQARESVEYLSKIGNNKD